MPIDPVDLGRGLVIQGPDNLPQGNLLAIAISYRHLQQLGLVLARAFGHAQDDVYLVAAAGGLIRADGAAADRRAEGASHLGGGKPQVDCLLAVNHKLGFRRSVGPVILYVCGSGDGPDHGCDLVGQVDQGILVGPEQAHLDGFRRTPAAAH